MGSYQTTTKDEKEKESVVPIIQKASSNHSENKKIINRNGANKLQKKYTTSEDLKSVNVNFADDPTSLFANADSPVYQSAPFLLTSQTSLSEMSSGPACDRSAITAFQFGSDGSYDEAHINNLPTVGYWDYQWYIYYI